MFSFLCWAFLDFGPGPHLCGGLNPDHQIRAHRYVAIARYATQVRVLYDLCVLPVFGGADLTFSSSGNHPTSPGDVPVRLDGFVPLSPPLSWLSRLLPWNLRSRWIHWHSPSSNGLACANALLGSPIDVDQNHSADAHACQGMLATGFVCFTAQVRGTLSPLGLRRPSTGYRHLRGGRIFLLPPPVRLLPIPLLYDPGGSMIPGES